MTLPRYQLRFEPRGGNPAVHEGGRGEVFLKTAVVFSGGDRVVEVAVLDENDRRPFYDAWEYRRVHEAALFSLSRGDELCVRVRIHEDAEWNFGGPLVTDVYYTSTDSGATWSATSQSTGKALVQEATLLHQQARP